MRSLNKEIVIELKEEPTRFENNETTNSIRRLTRYGFNTAIEEIG